MAIDDPLSMSALLQVLVSLVLLCGFILLCAWLYRRLGGTVVGAGENIRLLSALSLGNRDRIAVIQAGDKQLLLGVSPGRINVLHVFEEPVFEINEKHAPSAFESILKNRLSKTMQRKG
ncbi:MAG: flagellar biosynthetic protein FliO [Pseudomonadales bacterium]|nr:flagellar biosynthetic protein FliO [Pseudomonadales bacterium]